jgi:hypothetical protein
MYNLKLWKTVYRKTLQNKDFLNKTPIAKEIRGRTDKCDCIKLKIFGTAKETSIWVNSQLNGKKSWSAIHALGD